MEKFFHLKENGTTVSTEIVAGLTTFFAMSYIIVVNPQILHQTGMPWGGVFLATIIAAIIGTLVMGLFANVPYAQAPGMGLNAFFTYTVCFGLGFTWQETLAMVFLCGLINILITVTKVRKMIIKAIPEPLQQAIGGGIGLFVAYVGLLNVNFITFTPKDTKAAGQGLATGATPGMATLNSPVLWLFLIGLVLIIVLQVLHVKGAILIGIIVTTLIGIPMGVTNVSNFNWSLPDFGSWVNYGLFKLDFSGLVDTSNGLLGGIFSIIMIVLSFSLVDMFDTIGTLVGTANKAGMIDKDGNMPRMREAMMCDAIGTAVGALMGTSTVTTYVESSTGISEGGRTGMASLVTAVLFLVALFLAPLVGIVPSAATAPAFIIVGVMMLSSIKSLELDDMTEAIPAFLTIVMMPFAYSIATGIAFGLISYTLLKLCTGKVKEISPLTAVLSIIFIIRFACMAA